MRIAVIGAGVSGLVAAWLLQRRHDVTLFEASEYAGGHVHTVGIDAGGRTLPVDMGFIVYNERDYPLFTRLLSELGVEGSRSQMSFAVSCERSGLEYCATDDARRIFAQPRNLANPRFHGMLLEIIRFYGRARRLLRQNGPDLSLEAFLDRERFSRFFRENHLLPMVESLWSSPREEALAFPARRLADFMSKHGMLELRGRPRWQFIRNGSRTYVDAIVDRLAERPKLRTPAVGIARDANGVRVRLPDGEARFDRVVMALHPDQALSLLEDPRPEERLLLRSIRYRENDVVLHTDRRLLPGRDRAIGAWNYRITREPRDLPLVTYDMNTLQQLPGETRYCVTLNGMDRIDPARIIARARFAHPQFDASAFDAQDHLDRVQGRGGTWYCGAWTGYGFHEDGVRSAARVAEGLGVSW